MILSKLTFVKPYYSRSKTSQDTDERGCTRIESVSHELFVTSEIRRHVVIFARLKRLS